MNLIFYIYRTFEDFTRKTSYVKLQTIGEIPKSKSIIEYTAGTGTLIKLEVVETELKLKYLHFCNELKKEADFYAVVHCIHSK